MSFAIRKSRDIYEMSISRQAFLKMPPPQNNSSEEKEEKKEEKPVITVVNPPQRDANNYSVRKLASSVVDYY
jgi:hypothetical protein